MHRSRFIFLALLAMLLLSACQVRVRQSTLIRDDGSGRVGVVVAADEEFREAVASFGGGGTDNPFDAAAADLGDEFETSEYDEEGFLGVQVTREFETLEEYATIAEDLGDLTGVELAFPSVSESDGRFVYRADIPEFDEEAVAGIGSGTGFDISTLPLDDLFDIRISVKLPGELISHNADVVDDSGAVTWNLGVNSGPMELMAESDASKFPVLPVLVGAVLVLVIAFVIVRIVRSRPAPEEPATVVVVPE